MSNAQFFAKKMIKIQKSQSILHHFVETFTLKRDQYQIKNGFQQFVCLEIFYNLTERFFEKKNLSSKNLENYLLGIEYFKKTYPKRSLISKIDKI
jgi:hypothetical protein